MITTVEAPTASWLAYQAARTVMNDGEETAPRGMRTREVTSAVLGIADPTHALPLGVGREGLSEALAYAEALNLLSGRSTPELLGSIAPFYATFVNPETGAFDGAYGPRIHSQVEAAYRKLKEDPDSRQGAVGIWSRSDAEREKSLDYPCTLSMHFLARGGSLVMHVTMRSNDVWLGLPYDVYQFTSVQAVLARALGLKLGKYVHAAHSLHAYERDFDKLSRLHPPTDMYAPSQPPVRLGAPLRDWSYYKDRALTLLDGDLPKNATGWEVQAHYALERFIG